VYTTRTNLQARYDLFCVKSVVKPQPTNQPTVYVYDRIRLVHDCLHGPCTRPCSGLADGRVGPCNGRVRAVYTTVYIHDCVHVRVVYTCRRPYTRAVYTVVYTTVYTVVYTTVYTARTGRYRPYTAVYRPCTRAVSTAVCGPSTHVHGPYTYTTIYGQCTYTAVTRVHGP